MKKQENPILGEKEIHYGDQAISYLLKRSGRAKHVRLSISMDRGLEVVLPTRYPADQVETILRQREKWILAKLQAVAEAKATMQAAHQEALSRIRYLGKEYRVVVIVDSGAPIRMELDEDKAYITLPRKQEALLRQVIDSWYRWAAKGLFEERAKLWAGRMGLSFQTVYIRNQKTRWGSCSKRRNLNFNLRVIMAPLEVLDYVVIHELAHLAEMNHGKRFWQLVESFCPEYRKHLAWLKKCGPGLSL